MKVIVAGNKDVARDSLPFRILPRLKTQFPKIQFEIQDPNEEWDIEDQLLLIDTVKGIRAVTLFCDLSHFVPPPRITQHDFDAYSNLKYLAKLGKVPKIKIIGIPPTISERKAFGEVAKMLTCAT